MSNYKPCPICGQPPAEDLAVAGDLYCQNKDCFLYEFEIPIPQWNAPRPVEDGLREEIAVLKERIKKLKLDHGIYESEEDYPNVDLVEAIDELGKLIGPYYEGVNPDEYIKSLRE